MLNEKEKLNVLGWREEIEEEEEEEEGESEEDDTEDTGTKTKDTNTEEEKGEEEEDDLYFDPFNDEIENAEIEAEEDEETEKKGKEEKKEVKETVVSEDIEARARLDAIEQVDDFIEKHKEFADLEKDMRDLTAKAILNGIKNPIEFASRNVRPPSYWKGLGEKQGQEAVVNARASTIRGTSGSAGLGAKNQDYSAMSKSEFEKIVRETKSQM